MEAITYVHCLVIFRDGHAGPSGRNHSSNPNKILHIRFRREASIQEDAGVVAQWNEGGFHLF